MEEEKESSYNIESDLTQSLNLNTFATCSSRRKKL